MNNLEDSLHLYEEFLKIEDSDTWLLNDLLQYALEIIINDDEDCTPTDVSKDLSLAREYMLGEIDNAISEQKKNKKLPPMPIVASKISCLGTFLKEDELSKLERLLNGDYRGKKGKKKDTETTRGIDIERLFIYKGHMATSSHKEAIGKIADQERIDDSSARKAIRRGSKYIKEGLHSLAEGQGFHRLDLVNSLRRKIIINEIKKLLPSLSALTSKELLKDFSDTHKRGT